MSEVAELKEKMDSALNEIYSISTNDEDLQTEQEKGGKLVIVTLKIFFVSAVIFSLGSLAWISDSALVSLRVALNSAHGWGESFNVGEPSEIAAAPLWDDIWVLVGSTTSEWILTITVLSIALTAAAFVILISQAKHVTVCLFAGFAFLLSTWVMEYGVSGLEMPLVYLLVGATYVTAAKALREGDAKLAGATGLLIAATFFANPIYTLLVLPVAVYLFLAFLKNRTQISFFVAGLVAPTTIFLSSNYITHGTPLPENTVRFFDSPEISTAGVNYIFSSFIVDPVAAAVVIVGGLYSLFVGNRLQRSFIVGVFLYLLLFGLLADSSVSGFLETGALLAVPIYSALLVLVSVLSENSSKTPIKSTKKKDFALLVSLGLLAAAVMFSFWNTPPSLISLPTAERWAYADLTGEDERDGIHILGGSVDARGRSVKEGRSVTQMVLGTTREFPQVQPLQNKDSIRDTFTLNRGIALRDIREAANSWPEDSGIEEAPSNDTICSESTNIGVLSIMTGPEVNWQTCSTADGLARAQKQATKEVEQREEK